jgi:hypothetical protein
MSQASGRRAKVGPAGRTIEQVIGEYLKTASASRRREARLSLELLQGCLNGYAYQSLGRAEARLFDRLFNAEGSEHREYCGMFGPEKIVPELNQFFGWFLVRKVSARPEDLEAVTRDTWQFVEWLGKQGYITRKAAAEGTALAEQATGTLPRAAAAADLLYEHLQRQATDEPEESIEGHFGIARIEPGKLWLESYEGGHRVLGPLTVPVAVTKRLAVGWEVSGAVGRVGRRWGLVEVWNVYPG